MAKCGLPMTDWFAPSLLENYKLNFLEQSESSPAQHSDNHRQQEQEHFDDEDRREELLQAKIRTILDKLLDIAGDYTLIKQSATHYGDDRWDCKQVQRALVNKLRHFQAEVFTVAELMATDDKSSPSPIPTYQRHNYFLTFAGAVAIKLKQFLLTVGRLSELDDGLYLRERESLMISEQSIAIHTLLAIWIASVEILAKLVQSERALFDDRLSIELLQTEEQLCEAFNMDLITMSWVHFNRLAKYEDFLRSTPFTCACVGAAFKRRLSTKQADIEQLADTLPKLVLASFDRAANDEDDDENEEAGAGGGIREIGRLPRESKFRRQGDDSSRAYFVIWYLFSAANSFALSPSSRWLLLERAFPNAMKPFARQATRQRLSPHQEEQFKLLLAMLCSFCEHAEKDRQQDPTRVLTQVFEFFICNWDDWLGKSYFDRGDFRINGLTCFQLFAKLVQGVQRKCIQVAPPRPTPADKPDGAPADKPAPKPAYLSAWDRLLVCHVPDTAPKESAPPKDSSEAGAGAEANVCSTREAPPTSCAASVAAGDGTCQDEEAELSRPPPKRSRRLAARTD